MKKYTVDLKLPQIIQANDYHEFDFIQETFKSLGLNLKVEELPDEWFDTCYNAIVYLKKDEHYKKVVKDLKDNFKRTEKEEEEKERRAKQNKNNPYFGFTRGYFDQ